MMTPETSTISLEQVDQPVKVTITETYANGMEVQRTAMIPRSTLVGWCDQAGLATNLSDAFGLIKTPDDVYEIVRRALGIKVPRR